MRAKHFVNIQGEYLGGFADGAIPPEGSIEVPARPSPEHRWNGEDWIIEAEEVLAKAREAASLDRFEFAQRVAMAGFVTFEEAAAWAAGNTVPAAVQAIINSLPPEQQGPVKLDVLARPVLRRTGDLMPALAAAFQTDDAGLDALFGIEV